MTKKVWKCRNNLESHYKVKGGETIGGQNQTILDPKINKLIQNYNKIKDHKELAKNNSCGSFVFLFCFFGSF